MKPFYLLMLLAMASCRGGGEEDYRAAMVSGRAAISWVKSIEDFFDKENIDHFITNYGIDDNPLEWQTVVYFNERYRMQIIQKIYIDRRNNTVAPIVNDVRFVISEVVKIDPIDFGATYGVSYEGGGKELGDFIR